MSVVNVVGRCFLRLNFANTSCRPLNLHAHVDEEDEEDEEDEDDEEEDSLTPIATPGPVGSHMGGRKS